MATKYSFSLGWLDRRMKSESNREQRLLAEKIIANVTANI